MIIDNISVRHRERVFIDWQYFRLNTIGSKFVHLGDLSLYSHNIFISHRILIFYHLYGVNKCK